MSPGTPPFTTCIFEENFELTEGLLWADTVEKL